MPRDTDYSEMVGKSIPEVRLYNSNGDLTDCAIRFTDGVNLYDFEIGFTRIKVDNRIYFPKPLFERGRVVGHTSDDGSTEYLIVTSLLRRYPGDHHWVYKCIRSRGREWESSKQLPEGSLSRLSWRALLEFVAKHGTVEMAERVVAGMQANIEKDRDTGNPEKFLITNEELEHIEQAVKKRVMSHW